MADEIERFKSLQARLARATKDAETHKKDLAIIEDRLATAKKEAQEQFGTDDVAKLDKIAAKAEKDAEEAFAAADAILTGAGY